jgi:hypothetical protein
LPRADGDGPAAVRLRHAGLARHGLAGSDHREGRLSAVVSNRRNSRWAHAADRPSAPARLRAVPRLRNASTNSTRLKPYPQKPTMPATRIVLTGGVDIPILRVKLSSIQRQAPTIATAPHGTPAGGRCSHASATPPPTISIMPMKIRRSKFSLKTNQSNSELRTPSMLSSKEEYGAGMRAGHTATTPSCNAAKQDRTGKPRHILTFQPAARIAVVAGGQAADTIPCKQAKPAT